jgi:hypothetical protein
MYDSNAFRKNRDTKPNIILKSTLQKSIKNIRNVRNQHSCGRKFITVEIEKFHRGGYFSVGQRFDRGLGRGRGWERIDFDETSTE